MDDAWAQDAAVACIHPGWPVLTDRARVMTSWRAILSDLPGGEAPEVSCADPHTTIVGEVGYVICKERIGPHTLLATNVFVREGGRWRMVHHHAAPVYADEAPIDQDDGEPPAPLN